MEASLQGLALLGTGVWVCHDTIRGPGVQSSSGRPTSSIGCILLRARVDNRSFQLLLFPVNLGVVVLKLVVA